ncbi:hypothetical protein P4C99_05930 [Pontiellaceae bacterium B1224]|nr:hypothetical protein [Pontiellaceae bacterium B1224]
MNKRFIWLFALSCIAGCTTHDAKDVALSASATTALPVLVSGYGTAYAGKASYQNTSIALNLPDTLYAKEIQAIPVPNYQQCSIADLYKYMGSKGESHYIMHYPGIGLRKVLKISKADFKIKDEFPLTSRSQKWRGLNLSPDYNFFAQPGYIFNLDNLWIENDPLHNEKPLIPNPADEDWNYFDLYLENILAGKKEQ